MAGTVTVTVHAWRDNIIIEKHALVADSSDASVPNSTIKRRDGWGIAWVTNDPGATAPTDNYDQVINNDVGGDVMGGALANRDTSVTEQAIPLAGSTPWVPPLYCDHTLVTTNNAVNSAIITVYVGLVPFPK